MQTERQPEKRPDATPPARLRIEPLVEDFFVGKTFTSKIASYTLMNPLGSGGTSLVYLAGRSLNRNPGSTNKLAVAVKLLSDASTQTDPSFRERFLREAEAMFRLKHPNVIKILDCGISDGVLFLVTEYVQGLSLKDMLATHNPLPMEYSKEVVNQLCLGLGAVHGVGLMYRDMKPDNVLCLDEKPEVRMEGPMIKIIDFGAVKPQWHMMGGQNLTGAGRIIGTPQYMAPEQFGEEEYDKRVDIYSTGLVAYELITGKKPFFATNLAILIKMQAFDMPIAPSAMAPDREIPKKVDATVLKALAKKPGERFQTIEEFGAAFEEAWHAKAQRRMKKAQPKPPAATGAGDSAQQSAQRRQLKKAPRVQPGEYSIPQVKRSSHDWLKAGVAVVAGLAMAAIVLFSTEQMRQAGQRREENRQEIVRKEAAMREAAKQEAEKHREYQALIETAPPGASVFQLIREEGKISEVRAGITPFNATLGDSAEYIVRYRNQQQHITISKDAPHQTLAFKVQTPQVQKKPHRGRK